MNGIQLPIQIIPKRITMLNLDVFYPFIIAGTNPSAMQRMNQQIYNLVNRLIVEQGYYQSPQMTQVINGYLRSKRMNAVFSASRLSITLSLSRGT